MRSSWYIVFVMFFIGISFNFGFGQKGITTFGIQYKPIVPNRIIGTYEQSFNEDIMQASIKQKLGNSFGMVIRQGITNTISFETGLGFTQRNFKFDFDVADSNYQAHDQIRFIGYEIPIKGLVFIRLGKQLFMNTAIGASFNYFPSDIKKDIPIAANEYFSVEAARLNRVQGAILANIGFEFRTRQSGYFYLGSSYNLPFASIMTFALAYEYPPGEIVVRENIRGSYITLDLRYYFNEKPNVEQKR